MLDQGTQYSPERLADRAAIQDAIYRWCRGVDRLDFEAIRSAFHADAVDHHGAYDGGVDGLVEWIRERHRTIPVSMHFVGNMLIEFTAADEAVVETYCIALQRYPAEARASLVALVGPMSSEEGCASDLLVAARYVDHMTRRDGEWRIQTRKVVFDATTLMEAPREGAQSVLNGRRDSFDTTYRYLAGERS
jgi:hypothetical protein